MFIEGIVEEGHRVASGLSKNTPYPQGSITIQKPYFEELGIDFTEIHPATINVNITPYHFKILKPDYCFEKVKWTHLHPPETFSFVEVKFFYRSWYDALVYHPHPETKQTHFSNNSRLEILTKQIMNLGYGSEVRLKINPEKLILSKD